MIKNKIFDMLAWVILIMACFAICSLVLAGFFAAPMAFVCVLIFMGVLVAVLWAMNRLFPH
ncbi:MAG: hypothetical protein M0R80_25780 [Proteobacteria bacterium]|jgi:hypothetical protein|nr:hypothetical protein [Pseudomonadota bacterium]